VSQRRTAVSCRQLSATYDHPNSTLTTVLFVLIAVVSAVIVPITRPHARDTLAIATDKFVGFTCQVLGYTHSVLVHQFHTIITFALSL